ncbi:MAG: hypothetical protein ACR2PZ_19630 [Pseudomonadales bacterium]
MGVSVTKQHFDGRDQALDLIESLHLFPRDGALASGDLEDIHWHQTSLRIYVLAGSFETKDVATDSLLQAVAGDLIVIPARTLHAARCPDPATYVVGFESESAMASFRPEDPAAL